MAGAQAAEVYHVVLDIDWSISSIVEDASRAKDNWQWIQVNNETYRAGDHLGKLIKKLVDDPTVKVSFFSGGDRARNVELLKKIKPPELEGKSLYDIAYKVLSKEELKEIHSNAKSWASRYLKDLKLVSPDLKNVILVDDARGFIANNHGKGIWLGKTYKFYETYDEVIAARKLGNTSYLPPSYDAWFADRHRLARVDSILDASLAEAKEKKGAFANLVTQHSNENPKKWLQKGLSSMDSSKDCLSKILGVSFKKP